ncbi:MAG: TRAP transporter large permease subunit [Nisaea sp.]|uniref:TRAP transporter large permease subunit n=1 Tax=Nisaea sp. TaxID=2024842 RepID=UPI001B0B9C0F|nr:TRAP transporter large permease subunit [Nisaea sp.]MBO6562706.1 TRAP transporter large permease subunit [Nisaea sp.]
MIRAIETAMDGFSRFSGLAVAQFYLLCAAVTIWEVISRYVFHAPTQWAFEVVMVLCASAWMISSGYVTFHKRHIGITVFYLMASDRTRWWLDLLALVVGIAALFMLADDTLVRALEAVSLVERAGSAWNSPMPTVLKSILALGAVIYLCQLLVNTNRHFFSFVARSIVVAVAVLLLLRLVSVAGVHFAGEDNLLGAYHGMMSGVAEALDPTQIISLRDYDIATVSIGIVIALIALMMTGMPLGVVTLIVSIACALLFFGPRGLYLVSTNAYGLLENYPLVAVPLFVLMASILEKAGIAEDLFDAMSIFAGNLRGGVAVQTVVVAVVMAAMSGIMGGEIVMLGLVALPQMLRLGYDRKLTIGTICASGSLATLIPPSIVMIVYALSAQVSIGDLFMAGAVPGLMLALFYVIYVLIRCALNPSLAPTAEEAAARQGTSKSLSSNRMAAVVLSIFLITCVMGSIYGGIASITEAAGVGVFGAILIAAVRFRFNWTMLQNALAQTMTTVGTIIWLILGAVSFVGIYNLVGGGDFMRSLFSGLDLPPIGIIFVMMAVLMVLGTFMEWIAILFITVPIFAPVVVGMAPELGLEPEWAAVWFGVLFVMNIQIYFLSPPFGPACFWLKSVAPKEITLQEIFIAVLPFIGLQFIGLMMVLFFPEIALWLPKLLNG